MNISITHDNAHQHYPDVVNNLIVSIKSGKSKGSTQARNTHPSTYKWSYNWCLAVQGYTFTEVLNGTAQRDHQREQNTSVEGLLQERLRCLIVSLHVMVGQTWRGEVIYDYRRNDPISKIPQEVVDFYRKSLENQRNEQLRFQGLSKKEQDNEIEGLLKQLRGSPGFFEFRG